MVALEGSPRIFKSGAFYSVAVAFAVYRITTVSIRGRDWLVVILWSGFIAPHHFCGHAT
jgi:hypothetical protein